MKYTPRSEEESPAPGTTLLPPGEYDAVVKKAMEQVSKNENPMMSLILTVYGPKGTADVFDYLVATDTWAWKMRHFCESAGITYGTGDLDENDCDNRNVRVKLGIKKQKDYPDKNEVQDYLPRSSGAKVRTVTQAAATVPQDDDIPF